MSRSVYSVILDDEVVAAVDRAAMRAGTNRSVMMNRLLAAQLQYATPEDRIRSVFQAMQSAADRYGTWQVLGEDARSQFSVRSALRYKYNPTVKYSIELFAHQPEYLGVLRCQLRTQNTVLIGLLQQFYQLWAAIEMQQLDIPGQSFEMDGTRFSRLLRLPQEGGTAGQLAVRLTRYVSLMDDCMKLFFETVDQPEHAAAAVRRRWKQGITAELAEL